jgi:TRAP-type C4-dicarboxylate transport system permease small subunit
MKIVMQILVDAMLVFTFLALLPFAWLMRDGLGPDSVTSSGIQAVSLCFMTFYSGPVLIALIALSLAFRYTGKAQQPEPPEPPLSE